MRNRLIVASLLFGLLAAGIAGGAVLAQSTDDDTTAADGESRSSRMGGILVRVAEILGIEQDQVEDAFEQAIRESAAQKSADLLSKLVEMGQLTQEEADAYQEWLDARPEGDFPGFKGYGAWSHGFFGKGHHGFAGQPDADWLSNLVEKGLLTQEQSDAYQEWLDARPEVAFPDFKGSGERGRGFFGKGHDGFGEKH